MASSLNNCCHRTSSTNSLNNMSVDGGGGSGGTLLKRRLILTNLTDKQQLHNIDADDDINDDNCTSFDLNESTSTSMTDEQINNQLFIELKNQQQHHHFTTTTPRSRRKNQLPNRKNLSQSFLYSDENINNNTTDHNDELMEMQINTSLSLSSMMCHKNDIEIIENNNVDDDNNDDMDIGCKSIDGQLLLCRTDSGFNEIEDTINRQRNSDTAMINQMQCNNIVGDDISMMMTDV